MPSINALPYRCESQDCREATIDGDTTGELFYIEPNAVKTCPRCGNTREALLTPLAVIHLLVAVDPAKKGDIEEAQHDWNYGCETSRKLGKRNKHLTKSLAGCTCPECLNAAEERNKVNAPAPAPQALTGGDKQAAERAKALSKE